MTKLSMTKLELDLEDRIEITKIFDDNDSVNITQIIRNQLVIMESYQIVGAMDYEKFDKPIYSKTS